MSQPLNGLIQEQLAWRYATKRFDPTKKISDADWHVLEESLRLAPSSFGLQPWKFVVVKDTTIRQQLQPHSWGQPQIVEASHLVVLAAQQTVGHNDVDTFISTISDTRGVPAANLTDYANMMKGFLDHLASDKSTEAWSTRQVYLALGMLLSSAAMLKIDACPLEGIDAAKYNEILGLPAIGYSAKVACALGYRSKDDASAAYTKVRYPRSKIFVER